MLAVGGIYRLPIISVFVVILARKVIKYSAYARLTARFPETLRSLAKLGRATFIAGPTV